ncbi:unnamed protein product [Paramecium sonneborni]|uniref:Tetratricopeptide repeat protein n=1 Tax=Paramecium sonneborni TaxID=65129 RepID=A0A8S1R8W5_9CILI|nr:unnamed protein product [Paramecium sonneborni]
MILKFQKQKQVQLKKLFKDQQKSDNYTQRFKSKKLPFYCNQQVNFINKGLGKLKKLEKRFQKQSINLLEKDQKQANRFIQEKTKSYKKNTFTKGLEVHEFSKGEQNYLNIRIVYEKEKHQNISTIKLLRMNRNEQALEYIDQAINKNSDKDEYYAVKASILFQLNRNEEALEQFGYAIHKNPDIDKYYASKAKTLLNMNRIEEALEFF